MGPSLTAGLRLGAWAFGAGLVLGPARELLLAPAIGGLAAALAEAVVLALAITGLGWRLLRPAPARPLATAAAAVAVVLGAEMLLAGLFALLVPGLQRAPRGPADYAAGLLPLAWLAALPFALRQGSRAAWPPP